VVLTEFKQLYLPEVTNFIFLWTILDKLVCSHGKVTFSAKSWPCRVNRALGSFLLTLVQPSYFYSKRILKMFQKRTFKSNYLVEWLLSYKLAVSSLFVYFLILYWAASKPR